MLHISLASSSHVRHYSIVLAGSSGWEARLEEDRAISWRETHADWHRVERTLARVRREVSDLLERGWVIQPISQ